MDGLSFAQVFSVLAAVRRISPDKNKAFLARINHLRTLKFPPGTNAGKGTRVAYSLEQLFQLVLAFELIGLGMSPQRAAALVQGDWSRLRGWIRKAVDAPKDRRLYFTASTDAMADLTVDAEHHSSQQIDQIQDSDLVTMLSAIPGGSVAMIKATWLFRHVIDQLDWTKAANRDDVIADLRKWNSGSGSDGRAHGNN